MKALSKKEVGKIIGKRLRSLRVEKGLSQQVVADCLKVDRSTLTYWELGKTCPSIYQLTELSVYYQIELYYFIDGIQEIMEE